MKRWMVIGAGLLVMVLCAAPSRAFMRNDMDIVKGKIVASDVARKTITVKDDGTGVKVLVDISGAEILTVVDVGTEVVAVYKKDGNAATLVRPAPKR